MLTAYKPPPPPPPPPPPGIPIWLGPHACRIQAGKPLSALDGVPYAVKDNMDALPYSTTGGTTYVRPHAVAVRAVLFRAQG